MNDLISRQEVLSIIYPRLNSACAGSLEYQHLYSIIETVKQMASYNTEDIIYDNPDEEDGDIVFKEIRNGSQTVFITEDGRKATVQDFLDYLKCHIFEFVAHVEVRQKNTMRVIMEIMTVTDCDGDSLYERYCYGGIYEVLEHNIKSISGKYRDESYINITIMIEDYIVPADRPVALYYDTRKIKYGKDEKTQLILVSGDYYNKYHRLFTVDDQFCLLYLDDDIYYYYHEIYNAVKECNEEGFCESTVILKRPVNHVLSYLSRKGFKVIHKSLKQHLK